MKRNISELEPENPHVLSFFRAATKIQAKANSNSIDLDESEKIKYECKDVRVTISDVVFGELGTLFVTTERVAWLNNDNTGFSLTYPRISIHAISRDATNDAKPYIYCQIDTSCSSPSKADQLIFGGRDEVEDAIDNETNQNTLCESESLGLYPEDQSHIDNIYNSLCECAELHPDMDEDNEEGMAGGLGGMLEMMGDLRSFEGFVTSAEDMGELTTDQLSKMDQFASMIEANSEKQFEDAAEE